MKYRYVRQRDNAKMKKIQCYESKQDRVNKRNKVYLRKVTSQTALAVNQKWCFHKKELLQANELTKDKLIKEVN